MTLTDLWTEASIDHDAEAQRHRIAACRAAALPVWPVLAAATTTMDYINRKAVVSDRLDKAVAAVVPDPAMFAVARAELEATYDADYEVLARARATAAHRQAAELRRQRLFQVTQAKHSHRTATSQRYETAKKVVEGGVYADVKPGDNRSSGGEVKLEGAILDGMTARLIVQAYETLSPENQAKFDSIPLDKLVGFLWERAKIGTTAAGLENLGDERAPEFGKDDEDKDDKKESARLPFNLDGFQAGMTSAKWGMTAEAAVVPDDIEASSPGFGHSYLAGIRAFLRQGGFRKGAPFADYEDFDACVKANSDKDDPDAYCGKIKHETEDKKESARRTAVSLTNVGIDPTTQNGTGTDPSGNKVQFRLTDKDRSDLKSILYSDMAVNFSGVDVDEDEIIRESAKTAGRYCKTHQVWIGEGNAANHDEACKIEERAEKGSSLDAAEAARPQNPRSHYERAATDDSPHRHSHYPADGSQVLTHSHPHGDEPHGYYAHPEDKKESAFNAKPSIGDGFIRTEGDMVRAYLDEEPVGTYGDEVTAEQMLATKMAASGNWKRVWAVLGTDASDYTFDQRIVSSAHYAAMRRTAGDNPFAKKDDDKPKDDGGGGGDAKPDDGGDKPDAEAKPAAGGALDPTQMQPGQKLTLNYTLTGANPGNGSTEATFDSTDGTSYFFTYSKGRFAVTQQGDKWVDSVGTEFTFDAADDTVQDPTQAIDPATQATPQPPQPTASKLAADDPACAECGHPKSAHNEEGSEGTHGCSMCDCPGWTNEEDFKRSSGLFRPTAARARTAGGAFTQRRVDGQEVRVFDDGHLEVEMADARFGGGTWRPCTGHLEGDHITHDGDTCSVHETGHEAGLFRRFLAWVRDDGLGKEANPYTDQNPYQTGPSMQDAAPSAPNNAPSGADQAAPNPAPTGGDAASTRPRQMPTSPTPPPAAPQAPMQPQVGTPGGPGTDQYQMTNQPRDLFTGAARGVHDHRMLPDSSWSPRMIAAWHQDQAEQWASRAAHDHTRHYQEG